MKKAADARGGPAADALRKAAALLRERGDLTTALDLYQRALAEAERGPTEPKLRAAIELDAGRLYEEDLGRLDQAMACYERAFKNDPDNGAAIEAGRRVYRALGDWPMVARLYEVECETAAARDKRAGLLVELARIQGERLRDLGGAAARLEEALRVRPADEAAKELLATYYVSPDYPLGPSAEGGGAERSDQMAADGGIAQLDRAAALFVELAEARAKRRDAEGQIAFLRRALGADPGHLDAASRLERAYDGAGRHEELRRFYRQGAPVLERARKLGERLLDAGEVDEAMAALYEAWQAGDDVAALSARLGERLVADRRFAEWAQLREATLGDVKGSARAAALAEIASLYQRANDGGRYEAALLEALAAEPLHPDAYARLGEHLTQKRDYTTLVGIAEQALAAAPIVEQPRRLVELAEAYEKRLGDIGLAVDAWQRAEAIQPSPRGAQELRRLGVKQERWASMTASLERELEATPGGPERAEVLKRLGQVYRERHELDHARQLFYDALELKPQDAAIYRALAEIAEREGRQDQVAETLKRQLGAAKERVEKLNLLRRLAVLYDERLDDLDGTEAACLELLTELPGDRDALRRLEAAYERAGAVAEERLAGVLEKHAAAAATPAEKVPILHRLAALYERHGQHAPAAERLERVLKLDKHDHKAQESLGRLYEQLGKWAEAAILLDRALVRAPAGPDGAAAWQRFARVVDGRLNDAVRALKAWREVLERRPGDREALDALTRLGRARNDHALVAEVLERRQAQAEGEEAVALALERATLHAERLKDPVRAIAILRHVLDELDPRHLEAHARLGRLLSERGDVDGSLRVAERELFLATDAAHKLDLALGIARRWKDEVVAERPAIAGGRPADERTNLDAARRAIAAYRRVVEMAVAHTEGLAALAELYGTIGAYEEQLRIDEQRLAHAEVEGQRDQAVAILFELALTAEQRLGDARRAFAYLRRAHEMEAAAGAPTDGTLVELRRVAEAHGLWEELCAIYATRPGLDARLAVAEIADDKLRDPKRAFALARSALELDPSGERVLPELERLSERAGDARGLLEVYEELVQRGAPAVKSDLLRRRARVRESRQSDPSGALDEILRAFTHAPDDAALLGEIRRLAERTGRWDDALAVEGVRFHRAADGDKLGIAREAAALVEDKVRDPLRAFRAYLRAFQLAPGDAELRGHLWRLARVVGTIREEAPALRAPKLAPPPPPLTPPPISSAPPPVSSAPPPLLSAAAPLVPPLGPSAGAVARPPGKSLFSAEPTLEVTLEEIMFEESRPNRRDSTVELSLSDLVTLTRPAVERERAATLELSLSDVSQLGRPANGSASFLRAAPAPPPPPHPLAAAHTAWDELALVQMSLPRADARAHFRHLVAVAEMWERGAGDLDRAFAALASAFRLNPDDAEARAALERLAAANQAWDRLVAILDESIEATGDAERAVRLLLDAAEVRERQGRLDDAEARYHRTLGMRPDEETAVGRLEAIYRQGQRWQELATLLERRLHGMMERLPPGEGRRVRAVELAEVYERLGNTYEAIDAWTHVAREYPTEPRAFAELARLYESVGQWSKVIEALTRQLDLVEGSRPSSSPAAQARLESARGDTRARAIRLRIAQIFAQELELPERAVEAYAAVYEGDPHDAEAAAALERLYEKLGRWSDLDALVGKKSERATDSAVRAELYERRAQILGERLGDHLGAAVVLHKLRRLRPDDDAVAARLTHALGKSGQREEQAKVLRERVRSAERLKAPPTDVARLQVELGQLLAALGDSQGAERALDKALTLRPDDPQALAELARLRQGGADWSGYAAAREREAEVAATPEQAVVALVEAARVHLERRKDDAAARAALERALARDPAAPEALALLGALMRRLGDDALADELACRELVLPAERQAAPERQAELHAALGASAMRRGDGEHAARHFRESISIQPGYPPAIQGLADLAAAAGAWDEVEALLLDAAARVPAPVASAFYRRLADAAEQQGRSDDAYGALLEADRLTPGDLPTRIALGENRYRAHRYREAAQLLGALADHPDATRLPDETAAALYHAAQAELKLRRLDRALTLCEAAVRIQPDHAEALGLLAERALEAREVERGLSLYERQARATRDAGERAQRLERVADAIVAQLDDAERAVTAYEAAVEAAGDEAPLALLDKTLELERVTGRLEPAARTAARLLERATTPSARARRLRECAALDAALGLGERARERLRTALDLDPLALETLAGLSAMLVQEGRDDEAAQLLTRALPLLPPPAEGERAARAVLWMRLGEARERLRDGRGAVAALEKALEADPRRRPLRESLLERYGDDAAYDASVRAHRMVLLGDDPLHAPSLRALWRIDARNQTRDGGRRFLELLAVADAVNAEERDLLARTAPADKLDPDGTLDEDDHALLAHPEAVRLAEVFAALWEGTAAERAPGLDSVGARAEDRVSPVAAHELARAYSLCARMLGNRKTGLYLKPDPAFGDVAVIALPPTAVVVGPTLGERAPAELRFLLGRALEIARPEYVLAEALASPSFVRLFAGILRAFHPRHARRRTDEADEAAMWKRALPYKVAKRLAELFRALGDTPFSSVRWRRAVRMTGNRAGLLASGDVRAAAGVLKAEGDHEAVLDLARFAASDDYLALRAKLDGALARR